jgi:hypothetical protein
MQIPYVSASLLSLAACTSTIATSNPPVSATQQLIVSSSEAKAIGSLPVAQLGPGPGSGRQAHDVVGADQLLPGMAADLLIADKTAST